MERIVLYRLGEGYLSGAVPAAGIKPRDLGYTPLGEASLYSFTPALVLKKEDRLGGFFVETAWGQAFMPYTESAPDRKVGDRFTAQIIRESVEDKPPRATEYFTLPFGGCEIKRSPRGGKVLFASPCGDGKVAEKLSAVAVGRGLRLKVFDCRRCLKEVELFLNFLKRLKEFLPFKWFHFYTQILTQEAQSVELLSEEGEIRLHLESFNELFDPDGRVRFKSCSLWRLVKVLSPRRVERLVLSGKLPLGELVESAPDGFVLIAESEGLVFIDVNGNGPPVELNRAAAEALVELYNSRRWGGPLAVDFISIKEAASREAFKRDLKRLLLRTPCRGLGFTAAGFYEILCPRYTKPLSEVLTQKSPYCGRIKRDDFLLLEILEAIGDPKGELPKIVIHPLRRGLKEALKGRLGFEPPVEEDCNIPPDRFEVLF